MKYIHVPGCTCATSHDYSARRDLLIAEYVARRGDPTPGWVAECTPSGSCGGWLAPEHDGEGWPANHHDPELLRLHSAALSARAAVEGMPDYGAPGYDYGARHVADGAANAAADALAEALRCAPWGAQPDGSFVTRRSTRIASGDDMIDLHAPARRGVLATAETSGYGRSCHLLRLSTRAEASTARDVERARDRASNVAREAIAAVLTGDSRGRPPRGMALVRAGTGGRDGPPVGPAVARLAAHRLPGVRTRRV